MSTQILKILVIIQFIFSHIVHMFSVIRDGYFNTLYLKVMNITLYTYCTHKIHKKYMIYTTPRQWPKPLPTCTYTPTFRSQFEYHFRNFPHIHMFNININTSFMPKSSNTTYPSYEFVWELMTRTYKGEQLQFLRLENRSKENTLG